MRTKWIVLFVVLGVLVVGLTRASEAPPLPGSEPDAATIELIEAQNRAQLLERGQFFPRSIPEDMHGLIKRSSQRARQAISIFLVTCLTLLLFLVLPLFERDKVVVERPLGTDETHVHRV
jgi:predicted secreted protein